MKANIYAAHVADARGLFMKKSVSLMYNNIFCFVYWNAACKINLHFCFSNKTKPFLKVATFSVVSHGSDYVVENIDTVLLLGCRVQWELFGSYNLQYYPGDNSQDVFLSVVIKEALFLFLCSSVFSLSVCATFSSLSPSFLHSAVV